MKILQLSDIHYGADYDGKFSTVSNSDVEVHPVILDDYEA